MTVDELIEKLQKLSKQGNGNNKVVIGIWEFNYDMFSPKGEIKSCEIVNNGKEELCAIATN